MADKKHEEQVKICERVLPRLKTAHNEMNKAAGEMKKRLDASDRKISEQAAAIKAAVATVKAAHKAHFQAEMKRLKADAGQNEELLHLIEKLLALRDDPKAFAKAASRVDWSKVRNNAGTWSLQYNTDATTGALSELRDVLRATAKGLPKYFG